MATVTEAATSTQVFTKEELDALRNALNKGRHGMGGETSHPPEERHESSDNWRNDVFLLVKFLRDLRYLLKTIIDKRVPEEHRKGYVAVFLKTQNDVEMAIHLLQGIEGPESGLFGRLEKAGLTGESLLVKLHEFGHTISHGPVLAVLGIGDRILGSLCSVVPLEAFKELKEIVEHRVEFGADDEIIQLHLNS
jgi:hypothetical protein